MLLVGLQRSSDYNSKHWSTAGKPHSSSAPTVPAGQEPILGKGQPELKRVHSSGASADFKHDQLSQQLVSRRLLAQAELWQCWSQQQSKGQQGSQGSCLKTKALKRKEMKTRRQDPPWPQGDGEAEVRQLQKG